MSSSDPSSSVPTSYAAAEAELEEILAALEGEGVDVDQLSGHVTRARELITWCRGQVAQAEITITELLADAPDVRLPVTRQLDDDQVEELLEKDARDEVALDEVLPDDDLLPEDAPAADDPDD